MLVLENYIPAFVIFFGSILLSRILTEKGNKYLTQEQKSGLVDLFSKNRIYGLGIVIGIVILYMMVMNFKLVSLITGTIIYIIVLLIFMSFTTYRSFKLLKQANYPQVYIKLYFWSTSIRLTGMIIFFLLLFYPMMQQSLE